MKFKIQLIIYLLLPFLAMADFNDSWHLESSRDGVKIFSKRVDGARYKQIKGVTTIKAPYELVCEILTDFSGHDRLFEHVKESEILSEEGDSLAYVYTMESTVWPAQDRYHVSKMTSVWKERECTINFEIVPDYMEKRIDAIEMKRQQGFWKISSDEDGVCSIELFIDKNPGGYIPSWLVNSLIIDTPHNMLQNIRNVLENYPRP